MNKSLNRGLFIYLILMLILGGMFYTVSRNYDRVDYTYNNSSLEEDLQHDNVNRVIITQNAEVPTGKVEVQFKTGGSVKFYSPDVKETENLLKTNELKDYSVRDVARPGIIEKMIPYMFVAVLLLYL